jgi:hypothetical protein
MIAEISPGFSTIIMAATTPTKPPITLKAMRARNTQIIAITPRLKPWRSYQDTDNTGESEGVVLLIDDQNYN